MARVVDRLSSLKVFKLKKPGMYPDGAGLYLQVTGDGEERVAKSWILRFMVRGRAREMGLGSVTALGLGEAREKAAECRKLLLAGIDPIEARKEVRSKASLEAAKALTFDECAKQYIAGHKAGWSNSKHAAQWTATLNTYAKPVIGELSVRAVDTALVVKILEPIWTTKPETAKRVRGRIEAVLDWAKAHEYRSGDNPARWKGHLDKILVPRKQLGSVKHHAALPYQEVADFIKALRKQPGIAARALEFLILTASRTGEVIGVRPAEVRGKIWTVPKERMKNKEEHRVPLSSPAKAIVDTLRAEYHGGYLFPGGKRDKPLSDMAMLELLRRMGRDDVTVHGFRSTFRDWASELTDASNEVIEMALAHTIESKVEAAYRRGDLMLKRSLLMEEWAQFCGGAQTSGDGQVIELLRFGSTG